MASDSQSIVSATALRAVSLTRAAQASLRSSRRPSTMTIEPSRPSSGYGPIGGNQSISTSLLVSASGSSTGPSTYWSDSVADSAAAVVMPSTPALVPEDKKRPLPKVQFLELTADPQPPAKSDAEKASNAEFKEQLAENTKRINDLQDSYQQKLVIDADEKAERKKQEAQAERKERKRLARLAASDRAAAAVLAETVPYAGESGNLSPCIIRKMAAYRPGSQMVSDDRFPVFRRT